MSGIPLVQRADGHRRRLAVMADDGTWTYAELLAASERVAARLLAGRADLEEARVAFLVPPGRAWVALQWGIWRAGGVAVPLCLQHPEPELAYVVDDAEAETLIVAPELQGRLQPVADSRELPLLAPASLVDPGSPTWKTGSAAADATAAVPGNSDPATGGLASARPASVDSTGTPALPAVGADRRAMLVYTSGTTSRPKAVVFTHAMIAAQVESLVEAWGWRPDDRVLLVLPLHHVHGIVNVVCCALWSGAVCEMLPAFDAARCWERLASGEPTLFMAVPTVYAKLLRVWEEAPAATRERWSAGARRLRLMVSGSAALPPTLFARWREITGHTLLERYGMTEIGMALSNPLRGERRPGYVGTPLPGVEARLVDPDGRPVAGGEPGEIEVRGPTVFAGYWRRPEATAAAFRDDGWFRTGDEAVVEAGSYRILGRQSVDVLKSGGYKISALEVEAALREHPAIEDCAVVGVADPEWGQRVAAAVVLAPGQRLELEELREWGKQRLAAYKVPTRLVVLPDLPRNPLGKVVKGELAARFVGDGSA